MHAKSMFLKLLVYNQPIVYVRGSRLLPSHYFGDVLDSEKILPSWHSCAVVENRGNMRVYCFYETTSHHSFCCFQGSSHKTHADYDAEIIWWSNWCFCFMKKTPLLHYGQYLVVKLKLIKMRRLSVDLSLISMMELVHAQQWVQHLRLWFFG